VLLLKLSSELSSCPDLPPGDGAELAAALSEVERLGGAPGAELATADEYESAADTLKAIEAPLREDFECDEAPALRRAAARAAAQHFGCSNVLCAATAGLTRADARALFRAQRCSRCMIARYCSAECQGADWAAGHKSVCRALAAEREAE
jgi:hypothetical protein